MAVFIGLKIRRTDKSWLRKYAWPDLCVCRNETADLQFRSDPVSETDRERLGRLAGEYLLNPAE
jgi:hypothetical protein